MCLCVIATRCIAACNGQLTLTRHPEGYLLIYPRPDLGSGRDAS